MTTTLATTNAQTDIIERVVVVGEEGRGGDRGGVALLARVLN